MDDSNDERATGARRHIFADRQLSLSRTRSTYAWQRCSTNLGDLEAVAARARVVKDVGNLVKDEVLDLYLVVDCSECGERVAELWDGSVQDAGIFQTCATGLFLAGALQRISCGGQGAKMMQ
jgi:hypothetical protein